MKGLKFIKLSINYDEWRIETDIDGAWDNWGDIKENEKTGLLVFVPYASRLQIPSEVLRGIADFLDKHNKSRAKLLSNID